MWQEHFLASFWVRHLLVMEDLENEVNSRKGRVGAITLGRWPIQAVFRLEWELLGDNLAPCLGD